MRDAPSESDAVFIWIRKTVDWGDERAFRAQHSPRFAPVVELWDDTFAMPFREFRREVRAIAVRNLARVRGAVVAGWSDIPAGALVLPVDDDDWFAPATAETLLRERRPGVDGFRWRAAAVEVPIHLGHQLHRWRRSWFPGTAPTHFCGTNNYAIAKSERVYLLLANHRWRVAGTRCAASRRRTGSRASGAWPTGHSLRRPRSPPAGGAAFQSGASPTLPAIPASLRGDDGRAFLVRDRGGRDARELMQALRPR